MLILTCTLPFLSSCTSNEETDNGAYYSKAETDSDDAEGSSGNSKKTLMWNSGNWDSKTWSK